MNHARRRRTLASTLVGILVAAFAAVGLSTAPVSAQPAERGPVERITYCHATGSETNPYVLITTADRAFYQAGHVDHPGDVYPPNQYDADGQGLNGADFEDGGQEFIDNGCADVPQEEFPEVLVDFLECPEPGVVGVITVEVVDAAGYTVTVSIDGQEFVVEDYDKFVVEEAGEYTVFVTFAGEEQLEPIELTFDFLECEVEPSPSPSVFVSPSPSPSVPVSPSPEPSEEPSPEPTPSETPSTVVSEEPSASPSPSVVGQGPDELPRTGASVGGLITGVLLLLGAGGGLVYLARRRATQG
ncbi:hypothetical protein L600_003700000130 [Isoptericola variabilis J7]|uniref:LPXTG-motif cell wall anchor domain protein n=1 Tax=Isoptericola variabilis (strain 225) TaxID=743718 RepID=F6FWL5_ISOV2|nr:LPXTG-motif cell wall anchor domain protein [Isoptericola variabilis 225]TWH28818.1 hypothetical protein L600_003700000130 [Isoptericola variabilis J7]